MNPNWCYKKIGDVCIVERGGSPRPIDDYITDDPDGINWIKIGDTSDSMFITHTAQRIRRDGIKKSRYVQPGDFLLSNSMSFGRPYILKIDGCIHDGWLLLRDQYGYFDKRFLYYYLSSKTTYERFKSLAVGGVVNNLNSEMVRKVDVPIPNLEEQCQVADLLDRISDVIQSRQRQLRTLDTLIKARFVEMFGSQEDNPLRFNIGTLKDVADIYLGLTHTPTYVTEGKPFLSVRDISSGRIDFANCHYISEQEFASLPNGARPKPNDILFCRVGTIGKPVIIPEGTPEFGSFVSVGFLRKKRNVLNEYLKAWMEDPYFMKQVYDNVAGASQINLNTGWLKNFRILIPPIELQQQFASFVSQVDKSKVVVQKALDEAQLLFDSLMQKYFG